MYAVEYFEYNQTTPQSLDYTYIRTYT